MTQKYHRAGSVEGRKRRIEQVAYLYLEGYSKEEISEYADVSVTTIKRDIEYIESHIKEFLS